MHKLGVAELAEASGTSVHAIRSYQTRGLIPPPRREGRVAVYSERHLHRLRRIQELRRHGLTLRAIQSQLDEGDSGGGFDMPAGTTEELTVEEVAEQAGVPSSMVRSLVASGLIHPRDVGGERRYTTEDSRAVRMLLTLLGPGVPVERLVAAARPQLAALDDLAAGAVDLFAEYGRAPLVSQGLGRREESERVIAALRLLMHASSWLVAYHLRRRILARAAQLMTAVGSPSERAALAREAIRSTD